MIFSQRCIHIGLTPTDGVCGSVKKCSTSANYLDDKPACSVSSATDGEKCIKVDDTGRVNYNQAEKVIIQSDAGANVAVIIVRLVLTCSLLFYCLLLNHSFQINPNSIYKSDDRSNVVDTYC